MLSWKKIDNYCIRSECGQWFIAKVIVLGEVKYEVRRALPKVGRDATLAEKVAANTGEFHGAFLLPADARAKANEMNIEVREAA